MVAFQGIIQLQQRWKDSINLQQSSNLITTTRGVVSHEVHAQKETTMFLTSWKLRQHFHNYIWVRAEYPCWVRKYILGKHHSIWFIAVEAFFFSIDTGIYTTCKNQIISSRFRKFCQDGWGRLACHPIWGSWQQASHLLVCLFFAGIQTLGGWNHSTTQLAKRERLFKTLLFNIYFLL